MLQWRRFITSLYSTNVPNLEDSATELVIKGLNYVLMTSLLGLTDPVCISLVGAALYNVFKMPIKRVMMGFSLPDFPRSIWPLLRRAYRNKQDNKSR